MIDREEAFQPASEIVDISTWEVYEDFEVFPLGARDKSLRICPLDCRHKFCIPGHKYLFKQAIKSVTDPTKPKYPDQYWAEVIAFKIGRLMDISVPPAFVAFDSETSTPGSLIEWFTGYPNLKPERFVPGGDLMQAVIEGYDREKGRQHNLRTVMRLSRALSMQFNLQQDWKEYWGVCLCFDAVIGNQDRHQENWGTLWSKGPAGTPSIRLTPYFDNGTSLGHELTQTKMANMVSDYKMMKAYIDRGWHQMKFALDDTKRMRLIAGTLAFAGDYPKIIDILVEKLQWSDESLTACLEQLETFEIQSPFTNDRAIFVQKLTRSRRDILLNELEKIKP